MKIQYKLLLMVGLPISAMLTISIIGLLNYWNIKNDIKIVNSLHLDMATMLNADRDAYQAQRALKIAIDTTTIDVLKEQKKDAETNMQQTFERINDPGKRFISSMQKDFQQFSSTYNNWKKYNNNILKLAEETLSQNNARNSAADAALNLFEVMRKDIDTITDIISEQLADKYIGDNRRFQLEKAVMLVLNGDRDAYQAYVGLLLISQTKDDKILKAQSDAFIENSKQVKERVIEGAEIVGGKALPLKNDFIEHYTQWEKAAKTVVEISQSNFSKNRSIETDAQRSYASFTTMRDAIDRLGEAESGRVEESISGMNASINQTVRVFIVLSVVFILISLFLAVLLSKRISLGVKKSTTAATQIANGDLNINLHADGKDEIAELGNALSSMAQTLSSNHEKIKEQSALAEKKAAEATEASLKAEDALLQAQNAKSEGLRIAATKLETVVKNVTSSCDHITKQSESIRHGSELQAERITNTATAMEEMNATVLEVARNSSEAANLGQASKENAQSGARKVEDSLQAMQLTHRQTQELKKSMDALGMKTEEIGNIMTVIEDIADQTNLLALNAAIEAARAGEAGRGFAVVADEVRKLAEKTMNATKEVGQSIKTIQSAAEHNMHSVDQALESLNTAVKLSQESGEVLDEIVNMAIQTAEQVLGIATAAEEQSATSEEISQSVGEINHITSENMQFVHASTASLQELSKQVDELNVLIAELKTA